MEIIQLDGIKFDIEVKTPEDAILACGELMLNRGAVESDYLTEMLVREQSFTSAVGMGLAIPHAFPEARRFVVFDQLVFLRLREEITWGGNSVRGVVGIATSGDGHLEALGNLALIAQDPDSLEVLLSRGSKEEVRDLILNGK